MRRTTGRRILHATQRHPRDVRSLAAGSALLGVSAALATDRHVPRLEIDLFRLTNELPAGLSPPLQVVMQGGSFGAVWVVAAAGLAAGRRRMARDVAVTGTAAWLGAKAIKVLVARGRPDRQLAEVRLRGATATGLGFPSGHAAVATALATAAGPYLSRRTRHLTWAGAALVSVARVYVGAHLPLDIMGGVGFGRAVGAAFHLLPGAPGPANDRAGVDRRGRDTTRLRDASGVIREHAGLFRPQPRRTDELRHHGRRNRDFLQGLGSRRTRRLQPRLAP